MSFFQNLKNKVLGKSTTDSYLSGFSATRNDLNKKIKGLSANFKSVNKDFLEELMIILLESDIGFETSEKIIERLEKKCNEYYNVRFNEAVDFLFEIMHEIYGDDAYVTDFSEYHPAIILLVGVNGSGKTTSCAKIVKKYQDEGKKVAVVAADTFRAGAIDQLERWAERLNVPCISGIEKGDPSAVIVDGCRYAKEHDIDVLICDTAGRLQNKTHLMNELTKMRRVIAKEVPGAPHAVWLAIDATTGQNGLQQAKVFLEATEVTGVILTKMDGTAKGGIVLGIKDQFNIPVVFITTGEQPEDIKEFDIESYIYSIYEGAVDD